MAKKKSASHTGPAVARVHRHADVPPRPPIVLPPAETRTSAELLIYHANALVSAFEKLGRLYAEPIIEVTADARLDALAAWRGVVMATQGICDATAALGWPEFPGVKGLLVETKVRPHPALREGPEGLPENILRLIAEASQEVRAASIRLHSSNSKTHTDMAGAKPGDEFSQPPENYPRGGWPPPAWAPPWHTWPIATQAKVAVFVERHPNDPRVFVDLVPSELAFVRLGSRARKWRVLFKDQARHSNFVAQLTADSLCPKVIRRGRKRSK